MTKIYRPGFITCNSFPISYTYHLGFLSNPMDGARARERGKESERERERERGREGERERGREGEAAGRERKEVK